MNGYRTYLAAGLVATFGALAQTDWVDFLAHPQAGAVALGCAVVVAVVKATAGLLTGKKTDA